MSLGSILILVLIAGIVGSIGAALVRARGYGCVLHIVIGFIGAFVGGYLAKTFHLPEPLSLDIGGYHFPLLWSILGSVAVVAILSLVSRRSYR
jgi:uncharacterized membrane protein YeaQ/YmgE (transglycosylase-associated protein family)